MGLLVGEGEALGGEREPGELWERLGWDRSAADLTRRASGFGDV